MARIRVSTFSSTPTYCTGCNITPLAFTSYIKADLGLRSGIGIGLGLGRVGVRVRIGVRSRVGRDRDRDRVGRG